MLGKYIYYKDDKLFRITNIKISKEGDGVKYIDIVYYTLSPCLSNGEVVKGKTYQLNERLLKSAINKMSEEQKLKVKEYDKR